MRLEEIMASQFVICGSVTKGIRDEWRIKAYNQVELEQWWDDQQIKTKNPRQHKGLLRHVPIRGRLVSRCELGDRVRYTIQTVDRPNGRGVEGVSVEVVSSGTSTPSVKYVSWQEDGAWLGYLQDFPDYWTQGETLEDLKEHLRDLYADLTSGQFPGIRKVDDLVVS
jgi:hypothetical protein